MFLVASCNRNRDKLWDDGGPSGSNAYFTFTLLKCQQLQVVTYREFSLFLYQVKVTKGDETRTAVFKKTIRGEWPSRSRWYSGKFAKTLQPLKSVICFKNFMLMRTLES